MTNPKVTAISPDNLVQLADPLLNRLPENIRHTHDQVRQYMEEAEGLDTLIVTIPQGANATYVVLALARMYSSLTGSPFPRIWAPCASGNTRTVLPIEAELNAARNFIPFPTGGTAFINAHAAAIEIGRDIAKSASEAIDGSIFLGAHSSIEVLQKCFQDRLLREQIITADLNAGSGWKKYLERYLALRPVYEIDALRTGMRLELSALADRVETAPAAARTAHGEASSHSKALHSYLNAIKDFELYAKQRMKFAIVHKTPKRTPSQIDNYQRLLQALGDLRHPAMAAGVQAGSTIEYMTELLNACYQGCAKFELTLERDFKKSRRGDFVKGNSFTQLSILIAGKSGRISDIIAVSASQPASMAIPDDPQPPEKPPTLNKRQLAILKALIHLKAVSEDSREPAKEIKELVDNQTTVRSLNPALGVLKQLDYINSIGSGRGGGYWITETGQARIGQSGKATKR